MMKAARTSETLVNFYQITRRYNPEDSHRRTHRRENLESYSFSVDFHFIFTKVYRFQDLSSLKQWAI
jgi:hypothetical protein